MVILGTYIISNGVNATINHLLLRDLILNAINSKSHPISISYDSSAYKL